MLKQRVVGLEIDVGAILVLRRFRGVADQLASLESSLAHLSVAIAVHLEMGAQGVDGLHTDAVQSDTLLECLRVVLATRVQHADGLDHLALRDAASVVAYGDAQLVVDVDLNPVAGLHLELIDAVVDDLFQ